MLASVAPMRMGECRADRLRTIGDDDGVFPLDGLVGDGLGQVDGEEDRVHLATDRIKGSLEEDCGVRGKLHGAGYGLEGSGSDRSRRTAGVVEALVRQSLWVPGRVVLASMTMISPGMSAWALQPSHGGNDGPGVGRRSGLGTHCVGCESDGLLEHVADV